VYSKCLLPAVESVRLFGARTSSCRFAKAGLGRPESETKARSIVPRRVVVTIALVDLKSSFILEKTRQLLNVEATIQPLPK